MELKELALFSEPSQKGQTSHHHRPHLQLLNLRFCSLFCFSNGTTPVTLERHTHGQSQSHNHYHHPPTNHLATTQAHVGDAGRVDHVELRAIVFVVGAQDETAQSATTTMTMLANITRCDKQTRFLYFCRSAGKRNFSQKETKSIFCQSNIKISAYIHFIHIFMFLYYFTFC